MKLHVTVHVCIMQDRVCGLPARAELCVLITRVPDNDSLARTGLERRKRIRT